MLQKSQRLEYLSQEIVFEKFVLIIFFVCLMMNFKKEEWMSKRENNNHMLQMVFRALASLI